MDPAWPIALSSESSGTLESSFEQSFRDFSFTHSTDSQVQEMADLIFNTMYTEAEEMARSPLGAEVATRCVLERSSLVDSISTTLAAKLLPKDLPMRRLREPLAELQLRAREERALQDAIADAISRCE